MDDRVTGTCNVDADAMEESLSRSAFSPKTVFAFPFSFVFFVFALEIILLAPSICRFSSFRVKVLVESFSKLEVQLPLLLTHVVLPIPHLISAAKEQGTRLLSLLYYDVI